MIRFRWTEYNLDKIAAHNLSSEEVESAFQNQIRKTEERANGSFETVGRTYTGKIILIAWELNEEYEALELDSLVEVVFVITAYDYRRLR